MELPKVTILPWLKSFRYLRWASVLYKIKQNKKMKYILGCRIDCLVGCYCRKHFLVLKSSTWEEKKKNISGKSETNWTSTTQLAAVTSLDLKLGSTDATLTIQAGEQLTLNLCDFQLIPLMSVPKYLMGHKKCPAWCNGLFFYYIDLFFF